ncbi:MAG: DNA replication/repair protein RecF [Bacteroidia bacterium]
MYLQKLSLLNFKNYSEAKVEFSEHINCLTGDNGSGKTNVLDAIYYLSMCRSYFTPTDTQNIKHGMPFFMIEGEFVSGKNTDTIYCGLKQGQKKVFKRNQKEYSRLNEHIGTFPVVMIAPVDHELITEGSEVRRSFLNRIISQMDKLYLDELITYNKLLEQRNALLKQMASGTLPDAASVEVWDEQLAPLGEKIYKRRKIFIKEFEPVFKKIYRYMTGESEEPGMIYESQLDGNDFAALLKQAFQKDKIMQFTTVGIHKDDLQFTINKYAAKKYGSQGQQKSLVVALKLAQFELLKHHKNLKPVVMLDDLFDKLDDHRVNRILKLVKDHAFGQLFITDTHPERIKHILNDHEIPFSSFAIKDGMVQEELEIRN